MKHLWLVCALALAALPAGAQDLPDRPPVPVHREARAAGLLDAAALALATADTLQTATWIHQRRDYEHNALAKPLTHLPIPAYVAISEGLAVGVVAWSRHLRHAGKRWWWVPEAAMLAGNTWGIVDSRRRW